jgi:hypothetical protein
MVTVDAGALLCPLACNRTGTGIITCGNRRCGGPGTVLVLVYYHIPTRMVTVDAGALLCPLACNCNCAVLG